MTRQNTIQIYRTLGATDPIDLSWGEMCFVEHSGATGANATLLIGSSDGTEVQIGGSGTKAVPAAGATITGNSLGVTAAASAAASLFLKADNSDDAGDDWEISSNTGNTLTFENDIASAGTGVALLTLTPHATASSSVAAFAGDLTVAGNLTVTGNNDYSDLAAGDLPNHSGGLITSGTVAAARVATLNQDTSGTAAIATTVTLTDNENTDESNPIWFSAGAAGSGNIGAEADGDLTYNPSSGLLTAPALSVGDLDVTGTTTTLESTNIAIKDKDLYLGVAGGLTKDLAWSKSGTTFTITSDSHTLTAGQFVLLTGCSTAGLPDGVYTVGIVGSSGATKTFIAVGVDTGATSGTVDHSTDNVTDTTASGSGIFVPGADMKYIKWDSTDEWLTSDNMKVGGTTLTLGNGATLNNSSTSLLTITEATVAITGALTVTGSYGLADGDIPDNSADTSGTAALATDMADGTVGQINYQTAADSTSFLAANTAATKLFLHSTGTGSAGQAPAWAALATGDIPANAANTSGTAAGLSATLTVATGGTGTTSLTDKAVLISQDSGTDAVTTVAMTSSGNILVGGSSGPAVTTLTAGTNVSVTNADGSITVAADNDNDDVSVANLKTALASGFGSNAVAIGDSSDVVTLNKAIIGGTAQVVISDGDGATNVTPEFQIQGTAAADSTMCISAHNTAGTSIVAPTMAFLKSGNATVNSHTAVVDDEVCGRIVAFGDDGTDYESPLAAIEFVINGDPATGDMPGSIEFKTCDVAEVLTLALTIDSSQNCIFANAIDGGSF